MQQQKIMKMVSASVSIILLSSSLMVTPSVHAVTPDNGAPAIAALGGASTKEIFNMKAATGWGTVGASNVILTAVSGASNGQITKQSASSLCGVVAAGLLANWKPVSDATALGNMFGVIKGGSVIGVASLCGWFAQGTLNVINNYSPKADRFFNGAPQVTKSSINAQVTKAQTDLAAMSKAMVQAAKWNTLIQSEWKLYDQQSCRAYPSSWCLSVTNNISTYNGYMLRELQVLNNGGNDLTTALNNIKNLVKV